MMAADLRRDVQRSIAARARRADLQAAELDIYRRTLIRLVCDATDGRRKTTDNAELARIVGRALEQGNALSRRAKAVPTP